MSGEGHNVLRINIGIENKEIKEFDSIGEDVYKIRIKIKDKNIFLGKDNYQHIYYGELIVGNPEKFRFKNKKIVLTKAHCFCYDKSYYEWISFRPKYFIDELQFVEENENIYYRGRLCVKDREGKKIQWASCNWDRTS